MCCCQPAVAGGFICADLRSELSTHLAPQALFIQSSPVREPLLEAFHFPSTLGEVTLHLLSQACMFIYSSRGKWVLPPLLWSFPPTATFKSFPSPGCSACATTPAFSGSACLFTVPWGILLPHLRYPGAPPSLLPVCFLLLFLLIIQVFFFPWVGASLCRGLCWSGPGLSVGYRVPLTSPCGPRLPKPSGRWHLWFNFNLFLFSNQVIIHIEHTPSNFASHYVYSTKCYCRKS
jgi:hypothetical protein